jgi:hypothetical protein
MLGLESLDDLPFPDTGELPEQDGQEESAEEAPTPNLPPRDGGSDETGGGSADALASEEASSPSA